MLVHQAQARARTTAAAVACLATIASLTAGCGGSSSTSTTGTLHAQRPGRMLVARVPSTPNAPSATRTPHGDGVLANLPRARKPSSATQVPHIRGLSGLNLETYLHAIDEDVANFWLKEFNGSRYQYTPATERIVETRATTQCGDNPPTEFSTDNSAFYCSADNMINLTTGFYRQVLVPLGETAAAVSVAHENGHRVQDVVGILRLKANGTIPTIVTELQADCLAGVYIHSVYTRNLLEPGDIQQALAGRAAVADAPGTPESDPQAHGNAHQRQTAFMMGYNSGLPAACAVDEIRKLL